MPMNSVWSSDMVTNYKDQAEDFNKCYKTSDKGGILKLSSAIQKLLNLKYSQ
jgi:hypothetical protein